MEKKIRIAAAVPQIRVSDVAFNAENIELCVRAAVEKRADVIVFPELCFTGCTCGDLFRMPLLTDAAMKAALELAENFAEEKITILAGLPVRTKGKLLDCTAILSGGTMTGLIPLKGFEPFSSGKKFRKNGGIFPLPDGTMVPFFNAFRDDVQIDTETAPAEAGRAKKRRRDARKFSAASDKIFVSVQPGCGESTTDMVYDGQAIIAFHGEILAETKRFSTKNEIIFADVEPSAAPAGGFCEEPPEDPFDPAPFLPKTQEEQDSLCSEILTIQSVGLARRLEISGAQKAVVGISGGLDSTLALLAAAESMKRLGRTPDYLIVVTMPGFGTTGRTKSNAEKMAEELGCDLRKIDIKAACLQHFLDIGHDKNVLDVTYENAQARERTQILMDVANKERALVIGTGDLSEIALGWSTFNGDHISMYNVNCGIPKTLMRVIVSWYADHRAGEQLCGALKDVLATPVSPELLPADPSGKISQKTESILGAYELHDFYIWHLIRRRESPLQILESAKKAFAGTYPENEIRRTLKLFLRRFFTQQFKRSCCADGPHTTAVSLSPRTDWHMPSDTSAALWLSGLEDGN